jgi:tetratricopeptide (TPR) repeat protein
MNPKALREFASELLKEIGLPILADLSPEELAKLLPELGLKASAAGNPTVAIRFYEAAIEFGHQSPEIWYNLGNAHLARAEHEAAIQAYSHAIALAPDLVLAYYNKALAECKAGKVRDALEDFLRAARKGCTFSPFYDAFAHYHAEAAGYESFYRITESPDLMLPKHI